jgi:hypothetical protein
MIIPLRYGVIAIAMSNPPLHFYLLFTDWRWRKLGHTVFILPD